MQRESKMNVRSSYLHAGLDINFRKTVIKNAVIALKPFDKCYDTIVCRGTSGLLIAPNVADKLNKQIVVVRKDDANHSGLMYEGNPDVSKYIIIDDFMETGRTLDYIKQVLSFAKPIGVYFWRAWKVWEGKIDCAKYMDNTICPIIGQYTREEFSHFQLVSGMTTQMPKPINIFETYAKEFLQ